MKRIVCLIAALICLIAGPALAETVDERVDALPLDSLQALADEADSGLDLRGLVRRLAAENGPGDGAQVLEEMKNLLLSALREAFPSLLTLSAPALLWAINRQLAGGGRLAASAEFVCYLAEACILAGMFANQAALAKTGMERVAALIERFHPVLTAVLSASGAVGLSALMQPASALASGAVTGVMRRAAFSLSGAAAILAVAGNLSDRVRLDGLFRLCKSCANWVAGCTMTLFLGLLTAGGLLASGRGGVTMRTAEYAVDKLLPVIGKEMSKSLGAVTAGAAAVRNAVGVTGAALLLGLCLGPAVRMAAAVWCCRIAAAVTEPAADGPICRCLRAFADALQVLLVAQAACAALFLIILGAAMSAGSAFFA